jgi:hypothetical protein
MSTPPLERLLTALGIGPRNVATEPWRADEGTRGERTKDLPPIHPARVPVRWPGLLTAPHWRPARGPESRRLTVLGAAG